MFMAFSTSFVLPQQDRNNNINYNTSVRTGTTALYFFSTFHLSSRTISEHLDIFFTNTTNLMSIYKGKLKAISAKHCIYTTWIKYVHLWADRNGLTKRQNELFIPMPQKIHKESTLFKSLVLNSSAKYCALHLYTHTTIFATPIYGHLHATSVSTKCIIIFEAWDFGQATENIVCWNRGNEAQSHNLILLDYPYWQCIMTVAQDNKAIKQNFLLMYFKISRAEMPLTAVTWESVCILINNHQEIQFMPILILLLFLPM